MISSTYLISGVLLIITAQLFKVGTPNATTQTPCAWIAACVVYAVGLLLFTIRGPRTQLADNG